MINFISTSPEAYLALLINDYQARVGKSLNPGQAEYAVLSTCAYALSLHAMRINEAGNQMLVEYSNAPALDELARLVGVTRLRATSASATMQFLIVEGHGGVTIPAGTRIASTDGQQVFALEADVEVLAGVDVAEGSAAALSPGAAGNGYLAGAVNVILDPQAFLISAENILPTAGGTDAETDDALRDRIKTAPASYSVAGPVGAYKFFALSASPLVVDAAVISPSPGLVRVYPLVQGGGTTPPQVLDDVAAALSDERVRPLCDTVEVLSPTTVLYAIEVELTLFETAIQQETLANALASLNAYAAGKARLGQDIMISQIIAAASVAGVYDVQVVSPLSDTIINPTEVAVATSIDASVVGTNPG